MAVTDAKRQPVLSLVPSYSRGSIIPLALARWFYANPIVAIQTIEPQAPSPARNLIRFRSRTSYRDHYCGWGLQLTDGRDRQGRQSVIQLDETTEAEVAALIAWEAENGI